MTDYGKTRVVFITGTKRPTVLHTENDRRRIQVSSSSPYRPVLRRGSTDSTTILRARPIVLSRGHGAYEPRDRRPSVIQATGRENGIRNRPVTPQATTVTPQTELRSILKRTSSDLTPSSKQIDNISSSSSNNTTQNILHVQAKGVGEAKCNYRLPEQTGGETFPSRKSVSFREDRLYGSRRQPQQHVQVATPKMSVPTFWIKGLDKSREFFV